jgi:hypothetical protein
VRRCSKSVRSSTLTERTTPGHTRNSSSISSPSPRWPEVVTTVEAKVATDPHASPQIKDYVITHHTYCTDLSVVYGLLWSKNDLELWRCSPDSATAIQACEWRDDTSEAWAKLLFSYVDKVYESINERDNTIEYLPEKNLWRVKVNGVAYLMRPCYASRPPGRCTTVLKGWKEDDDSKENPKLYIIKELWVIDYIRFLEFKLFEEAHANGPIPGLAKLNDH